MLRNLVAAALLLRFNKEILVMKTVTNTVEDLTKKEYKYGFVTDIESDSIPAGLNEDVIRLISAKKNETEFMLEWWMKAYRYWAKLEKSQAEPKWVNVHYPSIDYQKIIYYAASKAKGDRPKSLEEVDPELLKTYEKLGIPLREQELLAGSLLTRCLTAFRWRPHSKRNYPSWELSSARSPKR